MNTFKIEIWPIENGIVVTRPLQEDHQLGVDGLRNSSVYREDAMVAFKEAQVALDLIKAEYLKSLGKK